MTQSARTKSLMDAAFDLGVKIPPNATQDEAEGLVLNALAHEKLAHAGHGTRTDMPSLMSILPSPPGKKST